MGVTQYTREARFCCNKYKERSVLNFLRPSHLFELCNNLSDFSKILIHHDAIPRRLVFTVLTFKNINMVRF